MDSVHNSEADNLRLPGKLPERSILVVSLLILGLTLYPFDFTSVGYAARLSAFMRNRFSAPEGIVDDIIVNVILFLPFGMSVGATLLKKYSALKSGLIATLGGALCSAIIEGLQLLLPFRFSSIFDVLSNSTGSLIGFTILLLGRRQLSALLKKFLYLPMALKYSIMFAAALCLFTLLIFPLFHAARITGWDKTYSLTIGNNAMGTEPWYGKVHNVAFSRLGTSEDDVRKTLADNNLAVSNPKDLICKYDIKNAFPVQSQVAEVPPLVIKKKVLEGRKDMAKWLRTRVPAEFITWWIMSTGRFSLFMNLSSDMISAKHSGQILAISKNHDEVNISVAQSGDDLIISMRTMTTGLAANRPQFVVPDVFRDTKRHKLLVTCEKWILRVYLDKPENVRTFEIGPGLALSNRFLPTYKQLDISSPLAAINEWLFALLVAVILGFLASHILFEFSENKIRVLLVSLLLALLPGIFIGYAISYTSGRPFDLQHVVLFSMSTAVVQSILLLAMVRQRKRSVSSTVSRISSAFNPIVHEQSA